MAKAKNLLFSVVWLFSKLCSFVCALKLNENRKIEDKPFFKEEVHYIICQSQQQYSKRKDLKTKSVLRQQGSSYST